MSIDVRQVKAGSPYIGRVQCVYGPSIVIDLRQGTSFDIIVTDALPFTIQAPLFPPPLYGVSQLIVISISNASGGPIGGHATFAGGAGGYRLSSSPAYSEPSNGFTNSVTVHWSGSVWHEVARPSGEVATA